MLAFRKSLGFVLGSGAVALPDPPVIRDSGFTRGRGGVLSVFEPPMITGAGG
jgi:hypothetical protein